jgi:ethanolamine ammonia-lyase small subunit
MSDLTTRLREITPARLLLGRCGAALPTGAVLKLRADHAAARDAVAAELDLAAEPWRTLIDTFGVVTAETRAHNKAEYLRRPDLGRQLSRRARQDIEAAVTADQDLQIAIGDGLSAVAVERQVAQLLPMLIEGARARGWSVGRPILVVRARVGVMNDIGVLLRPKVVVLLIGERPGLSTAESLSAYLAWRPQATDTDANRNVISNIHAQGVPLADAAKRILAWAQLFMTLRLSGAGVKEPDAALLTG